jgi:UrcA family protein
MKQTLIALAITGLVFTPGAFAQEHFEIDFEYNRAELSTPEGSDALYQRLQSEIRRACNTSEYRDLKMKMAERQCIAQATEGTVKKINSKQLLAIHEAQNNRNG